MNWYKTSQNKSVTLNTTEYENVLWKMFLDAVERSEIEAERLKTYQFDSNAVLSVLNRIKYPEIYLVQSAINSKNSQELHNVAWSIYEWAKNSQIPLSESRSVWRMLQDYSDSLGQIRVFTKEEAYQRFQEVVSQSKQNVQPIVEVISNAVKSISNWHGSSVIIEISPPGEGDEWYNPHEGSALVYVGGKNGPFFSYFVIDSQVVLDDIFEAGDEDSFVNNQIQSDYFNLIKEIRNPGSTQKSGKIVTVYTARPIKDRAVYEETKTIPSNIFVTTRFDSAEGIARDLGGSEIRDVWKIKIDSRHLITTLDTPGEKQYQVVGDGLVPIISSELISVGE